MQRAVALLNPQSQDGHTHVCFLRVHASDHSEKVQPRVEFFVGDEVEVLGAQEAFLQVTAIPLNHEDCKMRVVIHAPMTTAASMPAPIVAFNIP
jgi:hypothetical protein